MKKVLSLMLCVMMLITMLCVMPVCAFSEDNIEITTNVSKVIVKVTTSANGAMTALLVNLENDTLYGMDEENAPEESEGNYIYTFNFKMQYNVPTDKYKVVISGNVQKTEKEFSYVNINDKITFYTNLDAAESADIKQYFENNSESVPVDLTVYNNLSATVLSLVNDKIAYLQLNPEIVPADTDYEKNLKITAKDNLFQNSFATFMSIAEIADADEEKLAEIIDDNTFNGYLYEESNLGTATVTVSEVLPFYKKEIEKVTELELANYQKAFNDATILAVEKLKDYATLKTAFMYYVDNSLFTTAPDMTNINALVNDTNFWKELLRAENTDVATLVANAVSIAQTMANSGTQTPSTPGTGIGGGGAGGGGGGSIDKPTTPGASTGIVEKQEETKIVIGFSDLKDAEWAREAVESLTNQGIINGKTTTEFAPNASMTREEFVKVLIGAFDLLNDGADCDFSDVSRERWSYRYIASANRIGIVTGDGNGFNPTATISRQDMAVIIYRLFEIAGIVTSGAKADFEDANEISSYAREAIQALSAAGIINGMGDGTFSPKTAVTRAQGAKVIYELQKIVGGAN